MAKQVRNGSAVNNRQAPVGEEPERGGSQGVQSLETGIEIAMVLANARKPLGVSEIAALVKLSPSTVHRYLTSLTRSGIAEQLASNGKYDLGPRALFIGLQAIGKLDAQRHLTSVVEELADLTELTAQGVVWSQQGPTIIQWKDSSRSIVVSARLGSVLPLASSAAGLIFCAYLPPRSYAKQVGAELAKTPPPTNRGKELDTSAFEALLIQVRKAGLSSVKGDFVAGIDGLSAPVFDAKGELAFALSIMGSRGNVDISPDGNQAKAVREAAQELSKRLGYPAP